MSDVTTQNEGLAIRASDAEREQTVGLLQRAFADGRLTQEELEERVGGAYAARTRAQLRDLAADLPAAEQQPPRPGMVLDLRLLIILLCCCPPAGAAYWRSYLRPARDQRTASPDVGYRAPCCSSQEACSVTGTPGSAAASANEHRAVYAVPATVSARSSTVVAIKSLVGRVVFGGRRGPVTVVPGGSRDALPG